MSTLIDWHGGECPVPPLTKVRIFLRGKAGWHGQVHYADDCVWDHNYNEPDPERRDENDGRWHILQYEVVSDDTPVDED